MFKTVNIALAACLALSTGCATHCSARISPEQLQIAISKAGIFPTDTKVSCLVTDAELTASTYKVDTATETECKVDAVLIAKTVFEADPELSRAIVRFFDIRVPGSYEEVVVTVGDVAAYGAGKVPQDKLLSALKLTKQAAQSTSNAASPTSQESEVTQNSQKTESTDSEPALTGGKTSPATTVASVPPSTASSTKPSVKSSNASANNASSPGRSTYSNYGVTISYPNQWTVEHPSAGNTLISLLIPASAGAPSIIEMRAYAQKTTTPADLVAADPRDTFAQEKYLTWLRSVPEMLRGMVTQQELSWRAEDAKYYHYYINRGEPSAYQNWKFNRRNEWCKLTQIALPSSIKLGQNKSVTGLQRGYLIDEIQVNSRKYARVVAFSSSGCTIMLGLFCMQDNASSASAQFEEILAGMKISPTSAVKRQ